MLTKKKTALWAVLLILSVIVIILAASFLTEFFEFRGNNSAFASAVSELHGSIPSGESSLVDLRELTPFEWDNFYVFGGYVSNEHICEVLGFRCGIKPTYQDNHDNLVFVRDSESVCYIRTDFETPYTFDISQDIAVESDSAVFSVRNTDGRLYLSPAE